MRRLAEGLDAARRLRSRIAKEGALADALARIAGDPCEANLDDAIRTAARVASGRPLASRAGRPLGVGGALLFEVMGAVTGFDSAVLSSCTRAVGEMAEAFGLLASRETDAHSRPGIALERVADLADALAAEPARAGKAALLEAAFRSATPLETKYLAKALGGGLRIGAQEGAIEGAIARAFQVPLEDVRRAAAVVTDVGELAVLASKRRLGEARLVPGQPVAFMLASPLETVKAAIDPAAYAVEDKIDGVRAQAHRTASGEVILFARGLDRVTHAFPEVARALSAASGPLVLDGEIVALSDSGRARPFQALQPRLKKSAPTARELGATRVVLVSFDLLADASGPLLDRPWTDRRARLEAAVLALGCPEGIRVQPAYALAPDLPMEQALDLAFDAARARSQEGLMLKRRDASYDAGRRGQSWIKVKRAHATLDAVVVVAEEGHGKRAGALSDYTFAVWKDAVLVPIGKAYSGLTDPEIETMTKRCEQLTLERRGGVRALRPEIVIEVAFDGIQRSKRHPSGYALRFPRIVRIRDDKKPEDADRLETVAALFASQVASGHREPDDQLTLF